MDSQQQAKIELTIDSSGNMSVYADGKLIPISEITVKQSSEEFHDGLAEVEIKLVVEVKRF